MEKAAMKNQNKTKNTVELNDTHKELHDSLMKVLAMYESLMRQERMKRRKKVC